VICPFLLNILYLIQSFYIRFIIKKTKNLNKTSFQKNLKLDPYNIESKIPLLIKELSERNGHLNFNSIDKKLLVSCILHIGFAALMQTQLEYFNGGGYTVSETETERGKEVLNLLAGAGLFEPLSNGTYRPTEECTEVSNALKLPSPDYLPELLMGEHIYEHLEL